MAKALVIKGVNFSANALTQVNIIDDVPCTGLELDESTKSLTSLAPFTLTATKTPANTTDNLAWSSSDETVATVENGVVTPIKGGSVTITATCGQQTAVCAVTVKVFIDPQMLLHYYYAPNSSGGILDTITLSGNGTNKTYGASVNTEGSGLYARDPSGFVPDSGKAYPLMLPAGCVALALKFPNQSMKSVISWCDSETLSSFYTIKCRQHSADVWSGSAGDRVESVPSNVGDVDCFYISVYLSGDILTQEMLNEITIEALYEIPA